MSTPIATHQQSSKFVDHKIYERAKGKNSWNAYRQHAILICEVLCTNSRLTVDIFDDGQPIRQCRDFYASRDDG